MLTIRFREQIRHDYSSFVAGPSEETPVETAILNRFDSVPTVLREVVALANSKKNKH